MNKAIPILAILLVAQILLAFGIRQANDMKSNASAAKLITANLAPIDRIFIDENNKGKLTIEKKNDIWTLPDKSGFPASKERVQQLIDKLKGMSRVWPVATTEDAAPRFKVASNSYVDRVVLGAAGRDLVSAYIGSPAGYNKVHLRLDKENEIHAVELSSRDISTNVDDWIDREVAEVDSEKVNSIALPKFTLSRKGKGFEITLAGKTSELDATVSGEVFDNASGINISDVLGNVEKPEYGLATPAFQFDITMAGGKKLTYAFGVLQGTKFYVLRQPNGPFFLKVDSWFVDRLKDIVPSEMVVRSEQLHKLREQADKALLDKLGGKKQPAAASDAVNK